MPRLLQEALWRGSAGQEDDAHSEDEGRQVVLVEADRGPGSSKGLGSDRGRHRPSRFDRMNASTGINVSKSFDTKRPLLGAPEQRKINSPGERLYGQLDRLAPLGDRFDNARRATFSAHRGRHSRREAPPVPVSISPSRATACFVAIQKASDRSVRRVL
jgi:hypothetical protein